MTTIYPLLLFLPEPQSSPNQVYRCLPDNAHHETRRDEQRPKVRSRRYPAGRTRHVNPQIETSTVRWFARPFTAGGRGAPNGNSNKNLSKVEA